MAEDSYEPNERRPYDPLRSKPYEKDIIRFDDECDTALLNFERSKESNPSLPQNTFKKDKKT